MGPRAAGKYVDRRRDHITQAFRLSVGGLLYPQRQQDTTEGHVSPSLQVAPGANPSLPHLNITLVFLTAPCFLLVPQQQPEGLI